MPTWAPPASATAQRLEIVSFAEDEFFGIVEALQLEAITVTEPFGVRHELDQLIESFAAVCDRAACSGARVHVEFTPFSGIPDLATAWEIVRGAGHPSGGLVFDTWHYLRGERDDALLDEIPGAQIFAVQINDAAAEPIGSLLQDTWRYRRLPGEGSVRSRRGAADPGAQARASEHPGSRCSPTACGSWRRRRSAAAAARPCATPWASPAPGARTQSRPRRCSARMTVQAAAAIPSSSGPPDLAGRVVLVTGAAGAIGRAIALACGDAGADVAVLDLRGAQDTAAALARSWPAQLVAGGRCGFP